MICRNNVLAVGLFVSMALAATIARRAVAADASGENAKPPVFEVEKAHRGNLVVQLSAVGTIEPTEVADADAKIEGHVAAIGDGQGANAKSIDFNSKVTAGQVLAVLDDRAIRAHLETEEAGLKLAEAKLVLAQAQLRSVTDGVQREQSARKNNAAEQGGADAAKSSELAAKAAVEVAAAEVVRQKADVQEAQVKLDATKIRSPIDGIVIDRRVNLGQRVGPGSESLFLIARDLKKMEIWTSVTEGDIGHAAVGQKVRFTVDAHPDAAFQGTVKQVRLNAAMVQNAVTYTVVVSIDPADERLLPYQTANATFELARRNDVLLVSNAALRWQPRSEWISPDARAKLTAEASHRAPNSNVDKHAKRVWVRDGKFVRPVELQSGVSDATETEIRDGDLKDDDEVVVGTITTATSDLSPRPRLGGKITDVAWQRAIRATVENNPSLRRSLEESLKDVERMFDTMGRNIVMVLPAATANGIANPGAAAGAFITVRNAEIIARDCPAVVRAVPVVRMWHQVAYGPRSWVPMRIYGTTPDYLIVRNWEELAAGGCFTDRDVKAHRNVCVIGETVEHELFGDEPAVGHDVRINNTTFRVLGVLRHKGPDMLGMDQDDVVLAPWTAVKFVLSNIAARAPDDLSDPGVETSPAGPGSPYPRIGTGAFPDRFDAAGGSNRHVAPAGADHVDQILVQAASREDVHVAMAQITDLLRRQTHHESGELDDFTLRDMNELLDAMAAPLRAILPNR